MTMSIRWRSAFRYPQTGFLCGGTVLGLLVLGVLTGWRWIGLGIGAVIALVMIGAWFWQFRRDPMTASSNLLERPVMLEHLDAITAQFPGVENQAMWPEAYQWASASQEAAAAIAAHEPTLVPDLIEALYTVEGLAANVASSAIALEQVQTAQYRTLTQQQLRQSCDRLQATHDQLQQLRDQIVLAQLTHQAPTSPLPDRLQLLIEANKTTLNAATQD